MVPEAQVQVGWDLFRWMRVFAGYNFIYLSNVVRPGNQIDRGINPANLPVNGPLFPVALTGTITSPFRPAVPRRGWTPSPGSSCSWRTTP